MGLPGLGGFDLGMKFRACRYGVCEGYGLKIETADLADENEVLGRRQKGADTRLWDPSG